MHWPFNYPGDEYNTNVFNQVIILLEDVKDKTIEFIDEIKEGIKNDKTNWLSCKNLYCISFV